MRISYTEHIMNNDVLRLVDQDRELMAQAKSRKLKYFGHVMRHSSLEKIMLGTMPGKRQEGGQKIQWLDDITQWIGQSLVSIVRMAENRVGYRHSDRR